MKTQKSLSSGQKLNRADETLQIYTFGPGTGESIAIRLPDGKWGVVDCYITGQSKGSDMLSFLKERRVESLAFFCLTHPHADHFTGADKLLEHYQGKIERLWRYGGLATAELQRRAIAGAIQKHALTGDPEARLQADAFAKVIKAMNKVASTVERKNYIRITSPGILMAGDGYTISALRPDSVMLDELDRRIASKHAMDGYLLFEEDEGSLINAMSVVLVIEFGKCRVALLGDAEGKDDNFWAEKTRLTFVKVAHHGSSNGLSAGHFLKCITKGALIKCAVITPYVRCGLPRSEMVAKYRAVAKELIVTGGGACKKPQQFYHGLQHAHIDGDGKILGIEITADARVIRCD